MTHDLVLIGALLIGVVAGLRALTPPTAVAWGGFLGRRCCRTSLHWSDPGNRSNVELWSKLFEDVTHISTLDVEAVRSGMLCP